MFSSYLHRRAIELMVFRLLLCDTTNRRIGVRQIVADFVSSAHRKVRLRPPAAVEGLRSTDRFHNNYRKELGLR
jgi:hypothetical protein